MFPCFDCGKEDKLYSLTCTREKVYRDGKKTMDTSSRALCLDCANKERKANGQPPIKEAK